MLCVCLHVCVHVCACVCVLCVWRQRWTCAASHKALSSRCKISLSLALSLSLSVTHTHTHTHTHLPLPPPHEVTQTQKHTRTLLNNAAGCLWQLATSTPLSFKRQANAEPYQKFSKVGAIVYLLYKVTTKRTFENSETSVRNKTLLSARLRRPRSCAALMASRVS